MVVVGTSIRRAGIRLTRYSDRPATGHARWHTDHRRDPYRNLFLNTGHGTLGWTMACGSGRVLADLLASKRPQISTEGLDIFRYGKHKENHKHAHPAAAH